MPAIGHQALAHTDEQTEQRRPGVLHGHVLGQIRVAEGPGVHDLMSMGVDDLQGLVRADANRQTSPRRDRQQSGLRHGDSPLSEQPLRFPLHSSLAGDRSTWWATDTPRENMGYASSVQAKGVCLDAWLVRPLG